MSEMSKLMEQEEALLTKIQDIEEHCEGIDNENNISRIQKLNGELLDLQSRKKSRQEELSTISAEMQHINVEIERMSGKGVDKILEAIKNQRWFFFKNNDKILMDRDTGLLWANLQYFPWGKKIDDCMRVYDTYEEKQDAIAGYQAGAYKGWRIPLFDELKNFVMDQTFPFCSSGYRRILDQYLWLCLCKDSNFGAMDTDDFRQRTSNAYLLPCTDELVIGTDYEKNVAPDNPNYTERERLFFTLNLFIQNQLQPIFDDGEVTELYKKIYFDKPALMEQLQELQIKIGQMQQVTLLSSEFDYQILLSKYDIKEIDSSVIQYAQAISDWISELKEKLDYFASEKRQILVKFEKIMLQLEDDYEFGDYLGSTEDKKLSKRQEIFKKIFSVNMDEVIEKLLNVRKQADSLMDQIDSINDSQESIYELGNLERKERASFGFIAENTAYIVREALFKIERYENLTEYVEYCVSALNRWTRGYLSFKSEHWRLFEESCALLEIGSDVCDELYHEWNQLRFLAENQLQPLMTYSVRKGTFDDQNQISVAQSLISLLEDFKGKVDSFYENERKELYIIYREKDSGAVCEKLESCKILFGFTTKLILEVMKCAEECDNLEDRLFIIEWIRPFQNLFIDETVRVIRRYNFIGICREQLGELVDLKEIAESISDLERYRVTLEESVNQYERIIIRLEELLEQKKVDRKIGNNFAILENGIIM